MYAEIIAANGLYNSWYWLLVTLVWLRSIQQTLGIPIFTMRSAIKGDAQAKQDAHIFLDIHIRNTTRSFTQFGPFLVALVCFILASIATLGFWYDVAFLQGIFFIAMPMAILGWIAMRMAYRLQKQPASWQELCKIYHRHRRFKFGLAALFTVMTVVWAGYLEIRPYLDQL